MPPSTCYVLLNNPRINYKDIGNICSKQQRNIKCNKQALIREKVFQYAYIPDKMYINKYKTNTLSQNNSQHKCYAIYDFESESSESSEYDF